MMAAMRRHGYKGAFEMAATVDYLFGYDATAGVMGRLDVRGTDRAVCAGTGEPEIPVRVEPVGVARDVLERLLEAAGRGRENPEPDTLAGLRQVLLETEGDLEAVAAAGVRFVAWLSRSMRCPRPSTSC